MTRWNRWNTWVVVIFVFATAGLFLVATQLDLVNGVAPHEKANHAGFWAMVVLILLLLILVVDAGLGIGGRIDGVLVDTQRNRVSLTHFQIVVWTLVIVSAYGAAFATNLMAGDTAMNALNVSIPPDLWAVLGISTGSFVTANLILLPQGGDPAATLAPLAKPSPNYQARRLLMVRTPDATPTWGDMFISDYASDGVQADISKIQMFFFTAVLAFAYAATFADTLINTHGHISGLPELNSAFVIVLAISHAGYLTKKGVQSLPGQVPQVSPPPPTAEIASPPDAQVPPPPE